MWFIMWVESTQPDSDTVRRAKLHLVDLAGSERISKTGVVGNLQKEARYINLSLHYLEQVIVALHERSTGGRAHVPYRNSMMTSVLRDSLGGNCKTVMVGTAAVEDRHLDESISTCRFAQRVASIKNNAIVNEAPGTRVAASRPAVRSRARRPIIATFSGLFKGSQTEPTHLQGFQPILR
ncbi:unnamed protein product [Effrenium voratum]|nr:unnamed protein product [Effrenium voratum]